MFQDKQVYKQTRTLLQTKSLSTQMTDICTVSRVFCRLLYPTECLFPVVSGQLTIVHNRNPCPHVEHCMQGVTAWCVEILIEQFLPPVNCVAASSLLVASRGEVVRRNLRNAPWQSFA